MNNLPLKQKIKIFLFPYIASLARKLGFSWYSLGRSFLGRSTLIAQVKKIRRNFKMDQNPNPLNIYFLTMIGGHTHNVSVDVVLGLGLLRKGHKVTYILDDEFLPINEVQQDGFENRWKEIAATGFYFGKAYLKAAGFDVLYLSELVDKDKKIDIHEFQSIEEASILKHYKVGVINGNLKNFQERKNKIRKSINYTTQLGYYLLNQDPDRVVMSHGIYSTWGPPFQILDNANVPIVTYSKTKRKKTEKFNWNYTADWWDVSKEWERVKEKKLTLVEEKKIDKYLSSRIAHTEDVLVYNFGSLETKKETYERFKLDSNRPVFSLFTNVLWDAASAQREIVFSNPIEWVFETIEWFIKKPMLQLIVKIHPAEVVIGTNQPFANLIKIKFPNLPVNIVLIEPHEKVNSWSIYEITDLGLVHTTTSGMELPLVGVPCCVVSETHYREKGFTIDVSSKEEYFNLIENFEPGNYNSDFLKLISKRYAYLLFERYQMPFDVFDEVNWTDVRSLKFEDSSDFFKVPCFEDIIDAIIEKKEFLTPA